MFFTAAHFTPHCLIILVYVVIIIACSLPAVFNFFRSMHGHILERPRSTRQSIPLYCPLLFDSLFFVETLLLNTCLGGARGVVRVVPEARRGVKGRYRGRKRAETGVVRHRLLDQDADRRGLPVFRGKAPPPRGMYLFLPDICSRGRRFVQYTFDIPFYVPFPRGSLMMESALRSVVVIRSDAGIRVHYLLT